MTLNPPPAALSERLRAGLRLHLADQLAEAESVYREILAVDPDHAQALGMLATLVADGPDEAAAEALLKRHLALRPTDGASLHRLGRLRARQGDDEAAVELLSRAAQWRPDLPPIYNDLGVSLHRLGRRDEALEVLGRAVTLDAAYGVAHGNRGVVLFDSGRFAEAMEAHVSALANLPDASDELRASTLHNLSRAARKAGRFEVAVAAGEAMIAAGHTDLDTVEEAALALEEAGRASEAKRLRNDLARRTGLKRGGAAAPEATTLLMLGGVGGGHVPTRYLVDTGAFATLSVGLLSPDQADAPLGAVDFQALAAADVVFNTLGEVERDGGQLDAVEQLCARLGKPVLNPPRAVRRTGRHQAVDLFGDIAHMITPQVRVVSPRDLASLHLDEPILVRPAGDHGGENLTLLRDEAGKAAYLAADPKPRLLVSRFHDFRSPDGAWRKYRLIFVDRQVFPYHLAIGDDWLVHYWRAEMGASAEKRAEEERFMADWRGVFGPAAAQAAQTTARRLNLDYGGMDCALTGDGQLLLFEANACILLHLDEPAAAFPYKHRYVPPIREAFSAMVRARAAG